MRDTIGDIDLLVTAPPDIAVMAHFLRYPAIKTQLQQGPTRASVILDDGLQVDLRVVDPAVEGAALLYFTGSKAHNIALRQRAKKHNLKLSEYGLFSGIQCLARASETQVYLALGLPWIAPELREDRGEILAALNGQLPCLIESGDIKGDLHAHTPLDGGPARWKTWRWRRAPQVWNIWQSPMIRHSCRASGGLSSSAGAADRAD
ncbi:hypothetical protein QNM99_18695 [Pseudomonas sp. PCH446]